MRKLIEIIFLTGCFMFAVIEAHAMEAINLDYIAQIESQNCLPKYMEGDNGESLGCYQIQKDALTDVNNLLKTNYTHKQMMNKKIAVKVADAYINQVLPKYIKAYGKPDTLENRIIAYNAGIRYIREGKKIPSTTKKYIKDYLTLLNKNN